MVWINRRTEKREHKSKVNHPWAHLYNNARWKQASKAFRKMNPLCAECEKHGAINPSEVVDHIIPHKGNEDLFWNADNWQALCKRCHDVKSARE